MRNILLLTIIISFSAQAQPEPVMLSIKGFGGEENEGTGYTPIGTPDGGFILSYGTNSTMGNVSFACNPTGSRTIFQKYNDDLTVLEWEKCYVPTVDSAFVFPFLQTDGSMVLGGLRAGGTQDYRIRKEDASGAILWSKAYGGGAGEELKGMIETNDGGFIMYGNTNSSDGDVPYHYGSSILFDVWVLKLDSNGDKVWSKVYGGGLDEYVSSIIPAPGNGYYVVGATGSSDYDFASAGYHGKGDVFVIRIDEDGEIIWSKCLGGSKGDGAFAGYVHAYTDRKNGVIIASATSSTDGDVVNHNGYDNNFWLINLDSSGNTVWSNCFGNYVPRAVCMADDNTIWVAGNYDSRIVHIDNSGNLISEKTLGIHISNNATQFLYPMSNGFVLYGGMYDKPDMNYLTTWEGGRDVFIAVFAPWTTHTSTITKTSDNISIFPNPARDVVSIEATNSTSNIIITDVTGKEVYSSVNTQETLRLNTVNWARGMYYVHISNPVGHNKTEKLLLQ